MKIALIRHVFLGAMRDKFFLSLLIAIMLCVALSTFLGSAATSQKTAFSLVFAGASLRFIGILGLILFCVSFVRRSFETHEIEFLLARPVSRIQLLVSYAVSFSVLALILGVAQFTAVIIMSQGIMSFGLGVWGLSIIVENIIMVNVALFFAMIMNSTVSASMASLGLYVLARMMGQILGILASSAAVKFQFLEIPMKMISFFIPRLDLMGQSAWLIYGSDGISDMRFIFIQGGSFVLLVCIASLFDFLRKQF